MVLQQQDCGSGVDGHIATYAPAATLIDVGYNHFFRNADENYGGDLVILQLRASPGVYATAFLGNRVHHNSGADLHMNGDAIMGGDKIVSHGLVANNVFYENGNRGGSAINMDGVTEIIVRNKLLYDNHDSGISLYQIDEASEPHSNQVLNNTIIMASNPR